MAQNNFFDFLQGASNSAASNVSAPIDGINWLMRKAGMPVSEKPFLGSDWMAKQGLTVQPQNKLAGLLGESVGGVLPIITAAKAPQIARGLLQIADNASIPQTLNKQAGMALFDTNGLPDRGRDLIQSKAKDLSNKLSENGFSVDLQHSGSAAGPSSYLKVFDPETGRYFNDVRVSGHSKGAFNSSGVTNVATDEEMASVIDRALKMRSLGKSPGVVYQDQLESEAQKLIQNGIKPRAAYNKAREIINLMGKF